MPVMSIHFGTVVRNGPANMTSVSTLSDAMEGSRKVLNNHFKVLMTQLILFASDSRQERSYEP